MKFYYYDLNDIVFLNKTWKNLKKHKFISKHYNNIFVKRT